MQAPEFDNLMNGQPAKFAEFFNDKNDTLGLPGLLAKARNPQATPQDVQTARDEIAKREVEISPEQRYRMDAFIQQQRNLGTKERTIRRMVQRMWNITVI